MMGGTVVGARVDVWDPTGEGPWIVEGLRQEGFDARPVSRADLAWTSAELVVVAGDVDGALEVLEELRSEERPNGAVPVILVGLPEGIEDRGEGVGLGADAIFSRPVAFEPLVRRVRELVHERNASGAASHVGISPERTMRLAGQADPASSQIVAVRSHASWRSPDPLHRWREHRSPDASGVVSRAVRSSSVPPRAGSDAGARPGNEVPEPIIPAESRAVLSPWLEELLRSADRRVFPGRPPLALHFPAANVSPVELVPNELLEAAAFRIDEPVADDPIDAFTYVGGPALPPSREVVTPAGALGGLRDRNTPVHVATPRSSLGEGTPQERTPSGEARGGPAAADPTFEWPLEDAVLGRALPDGSRRGTFGRGDVLELLFRVGTLGIDCTVELTCDDGPAARMTFLSGELRVLDGPIATTALGLLRRRGRVCEAPADEAGAEVAFKRYVEEGSVARFERDKLFREAREAILRALVRAERGSFTLRRLDDTEPGRRLFRARVLARPLRAALVDAARDALTMDEAVALLGGAAVGLALGPDREAALAPFELPAELCELLVRMEGRSVAEILSAAPAERGLAGVLCALVAAGVLVVTAAPSRRETPAEARDAVRSFVESAAALAEDGDYFAILGLVPGVSSAELERVYRQRRDELAALPLAFLDLAALDERRREAIDAVDEAYRALADARRREAYAAALRA